MWKVKINGVVQPEDFVSEDAASQHAANIRGTDFKMKIEVSDKGFDEPKPAVETGRIDPDPKTTSTAKK